MPPSLLNGRFTHFIDHQPQLHGKSNSMADQRTSTTPTGKSNSIFYNKLNPTAHPLNNSLDVMMFISSQAHHGKIAFIGASIGAQLTFACNVLLELLSETALVTTRECAVRGSMCCEIDSNTKVSTGFEEDDDVDVGVLVPA
jgi:hypothetical protein